MPQNRLNRLAIFYYGLEEKAREVEFRLARVLALTPTLTELTAQISLLSEGKGLDITTQILMNCIWFVLLSPLTD